MCVVVGNQINPVGASTEKGSVLRLCLHVYTVLRKIFFVCVVYVSLPPEERERDKQGGIPMPKEPVS